MCTDVLVVKYGLVSQCTDQHLICTDVLVVKYVLVSQCTDWHLICTDVLVVKYVLVQTIGVLQMLYTKCDNSDMGKCLCTSPFILIGWFDKDRVIIEVVCM